MSVQTCSPGAYLTDGKRLIRVVAVGSQHIDAEDCRDDTLVRLGWPEVARGWRHVIPAHEEA